MLKMTFDDNHRFQDLSDETYDSGMGGSLSENDAWNDKQCISKVEPEGVHLELEKLSQTCGCNAESRKTDCRSLKQYLCRLYDSNHLASNMWKFAFSRVQDNDWTRFRRWFASDSQQIEETFMRTKSYDNALQQLLSKHFIIVLGEPGAGKSTIAQNLAKNFLDKKLVDKVVYPICPSDHIPYENCHDQLIIIDDIFKNCEAVVDMVPVFESVLNMIKGDCYSSNTYVVMTSRSSVYKHSMQALRLLEQVKCLIATFVFEIRTTKQELKSMFSLKCDYLKWRHSSIEHKHFVRDDVTESFSPTYAYYLDSGFSTLYEPYQQIYQAIMSICFKLTNLCLKIEKIYPWIQPPIMEETNQLEHLSGKSGERSKGTKFVALRLSNDSTLFLYQNLELYPDIHPTLNTSTASKGKKSEKVVSPDCGGVKDMPEDAVKNNKEPCLTSKTETENALLIKQLENDTKENHDNIVSGQLNTGEQRVFPIHNKEDSNQSLLPNSDLICGGDAWRITGEDRAKHDSQFFTLKPVNGYISGEQARGFFMQSGLPTSILGQIWSLADMNNDGKMDKKVFIAMHLLKKKLQGYELPISLANTLKADPLPVIGSFGTVSQPTWMVPMGPQMEEELISAVEKEVLDKLSTESGDNRSMKMNRCISVEVGDIDKSAIIPEYLGILNVDTALEREKDFHDRCAEKVPETEIELKEGDETENNENYEEGKTDSVFENAPRPDSLIAPTRNKWGNSKNTRNAAETKLTRAKGTVENKPELKIKYDFKNCSDKMDNDNHHKASVYYKVKSCIVSEPNLELDKLGENEKILNDRNKLESHKRSDCLPIQESSLLENTCEGSKNKSSLVIGTGGRNWSSVGGSYVTDRYCASSEKSFSTKNDKDEFNFQTKRSYNSSQQSIEASQACCKSCVADCSNLKLVLEEILDTKVNHQLMKMADYVNQRANEIQHSVESLRKSTLTVGLDKASSMARNSRQSNTNHNDGNNVNKTSHVEMDCNTMLDQTLHIEDDSETGVKHSNTNAEVHSMHHLKFQNMKEEDHSFEVEHYCSFDNKLSSSEADQMPSSYPETLSSFQGRSNVACNDISIGSYTSTYNIHYDKECEVLSDKCQNEFSDTGAVLNSFPDQKENLSDNGLFVDIVKDDEDMKLSTRDELYDKSIDKNFVMADQTSEQINTRISDSSSMYSSVESVEISEYHDPVEDQMFEAKHRDYHEEESEKEVIDNDVNGPSIGEYTEKIAESFCQEVMKEIEKSIEKYMICNNGSVAGDENRMKDARMYAISDVAENGIPIHEKYYDKDEHTELTAAFVAFGDKNHEQFDTFEADKMPDDLLSLGEVHNDEMHFDVIPVDTHSEEDPSVASLLLSTCCTPLGDYEGSCVDECLGSDCGDESLNFHVLTRMQRQRKFRHMTVKPSEIKYRSGWRKQNRKSKQEDNHKQFQRMMPSEISTNFSINGIANKPIPRQNKKRNRTGRNFIGLNKSVNKSSHCSNEGLAFFRSSQKKKNSLNFEVDTHLEKMRQEIGNDQNGHRHYEKFQYHDVEDVDSGIFSSVMSVRNSILKEHDTYTRELSTKGKKRRKKFRKSQRELHRLDSELNSFLGSLERTVARHVTNDGVVFGLERYFDSLNSGQTPSLRERMRYEWLRLMSFSNYTGEGSPVHLARNGFYHTQNNETHCFCCNTSYSNWTYSDNVQEEHRRISPNCPLVHGGIESNENISIESGSRDNQPFQAPATIGNGSGIGQGASQSGYNIERPAVPTNPGVFSGTAAQRPNFGFQSTTAAGTSTPTFSFHPPEPRPDMSGFRFPQTSNQLPAGTPSQVGQSAATVTTTRAPGFSFGTASNAPAPAGFTFGQSTSQQGGGPDISSQFRALTLQQSIGAQQPSDEPISGNPVIAPTQPLQVARQTGEGQLSISAQQPPETSDLPQTAARNQRTSEPSGSAPPAQRNENADTIEIVQLKHPRYRTMDVRMSSFRSWPNYLNQTPRQMAYAGFFHPGVADFARCFCCGGGLRNWEADDDPMVEHARWYPRCEYINKLKGTHFVQAVLRRHREHMAERQRELEVPQNTFLTPDPMTTSIAANLLDMGFTQERAREAILAVRQLRGRSEVSIEEVTTWMLDDGNTRHQEPAERGTTVNPRDTVATAPPQPARPRTPASSGSGSFESARQDSDGHSSVEDRGRGSAEEPQGATGGAKKEAKPPKAKSGKDDSSSDDKSGKEDNSDDEKIRKDKDKSSKEDYSSDDKSKEDKDPDKKKPKSKKDKKKKPRKRQSGASGGASVDVDTKSLKEENKQLKQMQVCKICMDTYVCITFLPCGHLVCCEDCAKNMRKCPICRKRIKGQVRTFMS